MHLTRLRSCPRLPSVNEPAVDLEKVRGASSLIVWDISTFTSSLNLLSLLGTMLLSLPAYNQKSRIGLLTGLGGIFHR